jgi:hypothetical protein
MAASSDTNSETNGHLQQSGAFQVYEDPADLLFHIDEVAGRR